MSKVKEAIEKAIEKVNNAGINTYGASIYTFNQVHTILQDLLETANEDTDETAGAVVTHADVERLVARIEERIDKNIHSMSDSDIVDEDSIEISLGGGRYSIENIDCDKDQIISEATYGIDDEIAGWAYDLKIVIEE
jgi:hypothetical protein